MVAVKIGILILYAIMSYVAIALPLTFWANVCLGVLVVVVALNLMECFMYRDMVVQAPGSVLWHLLNIMLFGVVHMMNMRIDISDARERGS